MKTFDEICDEVAKEYGYHDWLTLKDDFCMSYEGHKPYLLKAAERYANYKAEIAFEQAKNQSIIVAKLYSDDLNKDNLEHFLKEIFNPYKK